MTRYNYKSDFDFRLAVKSKNGTLLGLSGFDFEGIIRTMNYDREVRFHKYGDSWHNCFNEDGLIHVVCKNHKLLPGNLVLELNVCIPNHIYPGRIRTISTIEDLGIKLVFGRGEEIKPIEVEKTISYIDRNVYQQAVDAGYKGTQEEFYEALSNITTNVYTKAEINLLISELKIIDLGYY